MNCSKCKKEMTTTPICVECGLIPIIDGQATRLEQDRDSWKSRAEGLMNTINKHAGYHGSEVNTVSSCGFCKMVIEAKRIMEGEV